MPDYNHLRVFACASYPHLLRSLRGSVLERFHGEIESIRDFLEGRDRALAFLLVSLNRVKGPFNPKIEFFIENYGNCSHMPSSTSRDF